MRDQAESSPVSRTTSSGNLWVIVPAAGSGSRFGADIPKQYLPLGSSTVMETSLAILTRLPCCGVYVGLAANDQRWDGLQWQGFQPQQLALIKTYPGGAERCDSVLNGLLALQGIAGDEDWVAVHDVARPCVRLESIEGLLAAVQEHRDGGLLAVPASDTIKQSNAAGEAEATLDRRSLWHAQTPQVFRFAALRQALQNALARKLVVTDEASAIEAAGGRPLLYPGRNDNIKITRREDLALAEFYLARVGESTTE